MVGEKKIGRETISLPKIIVAIAFAFSSFMIDKFLFMGATFKKKYHKNPLTGGTITFFFGLHSLAKAKELKKVEKEANNLAG